MNESDWVRVRHMLDAASEAIAFARGRSREDLSRDRMLFLALLKDIEILGEAASKASEELQARTPEIPWAEIVGMRNRLIHAYFDVNLDIVWKTVTSELPPLVQRLEKLVEIPGDEPV